MPGHYSDNTLTSRQAFEAMYEYFSRLYDRTKSADIAVLLSEMSTLQDGGTADPAAWCDWEDCVRKSIDGDVDTLLRFREESD